MLKCVYTHTHIEREGRERGGGGERGRKGEREREGDRKVTLSLLMYEYNPHNDTSNNVYSL